RLAEPQLHDLVRLATVDPIASQGDLALSEAELPGDGPERGRLAGAVGADERDDLSLVDRQGHAAQRVDRPVVRVDVVQLEEGHRSRLPGCAATEVRLDDAWIR